MSATLDADKFVKYFGTGTHFSLPGRSHPVKIRYVPEATHPVFELALMQAKDIHQNTRDGDILIFFQSVEEVEEACSLLQEEMSDLVVLPLYATLPESQKNEIFDYEGSRRRCICSTNIAEASVTIDGVVYVLGKYLICHGTGCVVFSAKPANNK